GNISRQINWKYERGGTWPPASPSGSACRRRTCAANTSITTTRNSPVPCPPGQPKREPITNPEVRTQPGCALLHEPLGTRPPYDRRGCTELMHASRLAHAIHLNPLSDNA